MAAISTTVAAYRPLVINFAQRELKSRYRKSVLGWAWSLLNPLALVLTYGLVFGVFLRAQPPSTANGKAEFFVLWLFIGLIVWNLFTIVVNGSMAWLAEVNDLRKKIFFPTETAIFGGAAASLVQSFIECVVLFVMMAALGNLSWTFLLLPVVLLAVMMFALGLGFMLAIANTTYRDVQYLVSIVLNVGFFLVPIIYTLDVIPADRSETYGLPARELIGWNPVTQFVGAAHDLVYHLQMPSTGKMIAIALYAIVPFVVGLSFFRRRSLAIAEEL